MKSILVRVSCLGLCALLLVGAFYFELAGQTQAKTNDSVAERGFDLEVLVDGVPLDEYNARGRRYVEAREGAEYQIRIRNPLGVRVAVALSVDGLNTIDARRTTAFGASKWVIEPYGTITISGWQMSSARARRFYFTSERDSYGAKLGEAANLGTISAIFFREREPIAIVPQPRRSPEDDTIRSERKMNAPSAAARDRAAAAAGSAGSEANTYPAPSDEYAATGIGRNMRNDVYWVSVNLQPQPIAELTVRYEYHDALVRLGVLPVRRYPQPDPLSRRERASGFENRPFCPEPQ